MVALVLTLAACHAPPPVAQRRWPGTRAALVELARRAGQVQGFSARCAITVTPPGRGPVSLDGAVAAREPGMLRLQGWKLGQKAVDFTANTDGLWLWTRQQDKQDGGGEKRGGERDSAGTLGWPMPPRGPGKPRVEGEEGKRGGLPWLGPLMTPLDPDLATVVEDDPVAKRVTVRWPIAALMPESGDKTRTSSDAEAASDGWALVGVIDRPTLTLRSLRVLNDRHHVAQRIDLRDYRMVGDIPWPGRIIAGGKVTLDLRLSDIELNPDLPQAAFTPPANARRLNR